jgi:hypothetical protein
VFTFSVSCLGSSDAITRIDVRALAADPVDRVESIGFKMGAQLPKRGLRKLVPRCPGPAPWVAGLTGLKASCFVVSSHRYRSQKSKAPTTPDDTDQICPLLGPLIGLRWLAQGALCSLEQNRQPPWPPHRSLRPPDGDRWIEMEVGPGAL